MNIRLELIKAENGHIVQVANEEGQGVYIAESGDDVKKIVASSVMAYLDQPGSNTTPDAPENISRPNRAARRAKKPV